MLITNLLSFRDKVHTNTKQEIIGVSNYLGSKYYYLPYFPTPTKKLTNKQKGKKIYFQVVNYTTRIIGGMQGEGAVMHINPRLSTIPTEACLR